MAQLYEWQQPLADRIDGILKAGNIAINALPTGAGKTYIALDVASRRKRPTLVVCPKIAFTNWYRTAEEFSVGDRIVGVVNSERISLGKCPWYDGTAWHLPKDCDVIWDEIHKGPSGENSKAGAALARLKSYGVSLHAMSATWADSPLKLRSLGYWLGLHSYLSGDFRRWCLNHGCYVQTMPNCTKIVFGTGPKGRTALLQIREQVADRLVSYRINEIPGFPAQQLRSRLYDLAKHDAQALQKAYDEMPTRILGGTTPLAALIHAREQAEFCKCSLMAELVAEELAKGNSVVVFVNFRSILCRLESMLRANGVDNISVIHGGQSGPVGAIERQYNIDAFQNNTNHVVIATTQAGGVSVSLHDVLNERPRVSFLTPGWSASETVQALGRIRRAGGTPVVQTFVMAAGTEEEKTHKKLQHKLGRVELLNDGDLL
jgi:hypothetical protein